MEADVAGMPPVDTPDMDELMSIAAEKARGGNMSAVAFLAAVSRMSVTRSSRRCFRGLVRVTAESAKLLVSAFKALGPCMDRRENAMVREALLRGPRDLADPLHALWCGEDKAESRRAWGLLSGILETAGVPVFGLLYLCDNPGRIRRAYRHSSVVEHREAVA